MSQNNLKVRQENILLLNSEDLKTDNCPPTPLKPPNTGDDQNVSQKLSVVILSVSEIVSYLIVSQ